LPEHPNEIDNFRAAIHVVNPYAGFDPSPYPDDVDGWHGNDPYFERIIGELRPTTICEIGSWKGQSAITMAQALRKHGLTGSRILCVDPWLGAKEFWTSNRDPQRYISLNLKHGYPTVYYQFLANVVRAGVQDYIIPLPLPSLIASRLCQHFGLALDLIYLDASHDQKDVHDDLNHWWLNLSKDGVIFGDDYDAWPGVKAAVDNFAELYRLETNGNFWRIA